MRWRIIFRTGYCFQDKHTREILCSYWIWKDNFANSFEKYRLYYHCLQFQNLKVAARNLDLCQEYTQHKATTSSKYGKYTCMILEMWRPGEKTATFKTFLPKASPPQFVQQRHWHHHETTEKKLQTKYFLFWMSKMLLEGNFYTLKM